MGQNKFRTKIMKRQLQRWVSDASWMVHRNSFQDQEYISCVEDILDSSVFQSMNQYIQHGHTTCLEHCVQVSYLSYRICRLYGLDSRAAARAGLLHDLFLYDWHTVAKETGNHFHGFTHPRVAMNNAQEHFTLTDKERDMILKHMWPLTVIPPKSREGFVLMYADKYCSIAEVGKRVQGGVQRRVIRLAAGRS
ncbi:uncharacterized protein EV209_2609 [Cuneatibacter caecimuris]|uniref:HD/PDEase domain-containing protein n=2 Tax=Cuneatibacter caecimuris TaxID=1796618 RepID=A0A4Q7NZG0_9FIRM|nr:uncharacterized protein EV209_2609 [Cuneatibacter caecimuris]